MKILAFDSSAKCASVAVCEDERALAIYNIENGLTQSELLLPMIESVMKSLKLSYSDIELIATSVGPGSFTGVRIGAALLKGIAFGRDISTAPVSTIEALAENARGLSGIVVPVMDARRSQFYTASFKCGERLSEDAPLSIDALAAELKKYEGQDIYLVGDGYALAKKMLAERGILTCETPHILRNQNAYSVAAVAARMYREGKCVSDSELLPSYLRLPQAERERLEKENNK